MRRAVTALSLFAMFATTTTMGCKRRRTVVVRPPAVSTQTPSAADAPQVRAQHFLDMYNGVLPGLNASMQDAVWKSSTDVSERHSGQRVGAESVYASFAGNRYVVSTLRELLTHESDLDDSTTRQLRIALLDAAYAPGTNPELARQRVEAEARQSETLDGYQFCLERRGDNGPCTRPATANDIDRVLRDSRNLSERERVWNRSKELGIQLRSGLLELRELRNRVAQEMGYSDFYALQIADYGMTTQEMMSLLDGAIEQLRPLFSELHCYARRKYAERLGQPVPAGPLPAHWVGNRWAQSWPSLVASVDLDPLLANRTGEFIVRTAEQYYVSMGFERLPETFWARSDLYPIPTGQTRKKNSHASAWHIDLENDVRSLMSVEPDARWLSTAHHELGHIYYYMSYSRTDVPPVLRRGANRGFHEAVGDLISLSVIQEPYLRSIGLLPEGTRLESDQMLLNEALEKGPVFFMFAAGTMSHFEHDLYAGNLPADQLNARWWQYVRHYQGVVPPTTRDESHCDACTKTHINDDPGQYYDYALATLLVYQMHEHICRNIVHADPHACTYAGNREVGDWLRRLLEPGASRDWRAMLRELTGEDLSAGAMLRFYEPLRPVLERENAGQTCGNWE
jgi:peptidyl-dipeptidase A